MVLVHYPTKKALKESIGQALKFTETSAFGPEYKPDGRLTVAGRPQYSSVVKREFFANVTMQNGLIAKVK